LDWITLLFPKELRVVVRGNLAPKSNWTCRECGDVKHLGFGDRCLVEGDFPNGAPVLQYATIPLVRADLYRTLPIDTFPDIECEVIPVVAKPLDGLSRVGEPLGP
jgi:hypothetical protein